MRYPSKMQHRRPASSRSGQRRPTDVGDNLVTNKENWFDRLLDVDLDLTDRFAICASRDDELGYLRPFFKVLEISCHGIPWLIGTVIAILLTHRPWLHEALMNLFTALLFDLLVVFILKVTIRRRRPEHNIMDMFATLAADKFAFPSGHATRAAMVTCYMFALIPLSLGLSILVITWSSLVIISRVMLGRHHVSDIVFGMLIGTLQYYIVIHYLWMGSETCESIIRPIQEEMHL
ncbi:hypothetical protein LSH36_829g00107 [Paralvinella palmiformis]|uniref:Phosphatidic acid phosphatase type 2/haloperoxidase domain-containing protein n=1 Tax=Paralvinella palmiformis TaxID=53620 RepID=A0AAD9MSB3_9ANNE|nr:hypothetical protein LSH36_829g00107 [Paralvinella palmiformis]